MDDLISRQAALDVLADYIHMVDMVYSTGKLSANDCKDAAHSVLECLPAAEPRRGRWIRPFGAQKCSYRYQCSECGKIAYQVTGNCGRKKKVPEPCCSYAYCPNCGAKMEESE